MSEAVRDLLLGLPKYEIADARPGTIGVLREDIVAAGGDPLQAAAWISVHGGTERQLYVRRPVDARSVVHPFTVFTFPAEALIAAE